MQQKYLPFLSFVFLLIMATPFESGLRIQNSGRNAVVPTTSYLEMIVWTLIAVISFVYWIRITKQNEISFKIFRIHFILTVPIVLLARLNLLIRQITARNSEDIFELSTHLKIVVYSVFSIFCIGQMIFIITLVKKR
ncbi:hypothetical protein [Flavobacterium sp. GT3R68]|uniref:hypothetical protein n=1 Tax=Flavobacterium sp. GT3R68 TaxID=2594437 RepID=UPI000F864606|nr:hypothetical protein [Flavobacterium sp. GT3R68]RTY85430.1 hypothetical protein EKL32_28635 [Flavobacterium sp. GSN2]TRW89334.1 hypothetical protein FNW07_13560 [Flavobacterium sp. GT3R68]